MSSLDYLDLCRLCLVKDRANVPIFEGEGDVRQIFFKIAACLPVKVVKEDNLPKKICDDCVYKVEQFYQFWNTTANVEKQLLQWLGDVGMEEKQGYVSGILNPDQSVEGRLNANVIQQTDEHQNNMGMNMMDTMNLDMPMMMQTEQSQMTTMNSNDTNVQTIQAVPGTSVRPPQQERRKDDEDESSEDEDNSDDECDADEGLSVKEETEETANRTIEPTFVNVSLPCDEAGPSGLQQQKINEMSDMVMTQSTDGDPKSGYSKLNQEFNDEICTNPIHPVTSKFLHAAMIIKNEEEMSECDYCGILFRNTADLREHNKLHQTQIFDFNFSDYIEELPIEDAEDEMVNEHPIQSANNEEPFEIHSEKVLILEDFESQKEVEQIENQQDKSVEVNCESDKSDKCSNKVDIQESRNRVTIYASVCEICSRKFTTEMDLIRHVKKLHNKHPIIGTFYNCHFCGEIFDNESQLIVHSKLHSIQSLQLNEYENRKDLQRNLMRNSVRLQNQKNSEFFRKENDSEKVSNSRGKMKHNDKNDTSKNMVQCAHCGLMYPKKISLILHLRSHLITTRKKIEKFKMQNEYKNDVSESRKLSISDETTEYSMSANDIMKYVKMDSDKFYPCSLCKYKCKQKGNLKSHIIRRHASTAFFRCEICKRNFKMKYDLTFHEQNIHSIFTCKDCGMKLNSKIEMIYHKRIHLKKTFQCNVCEYSSNQKGNLKIHIINRHEKKF